MMKKLISTITILVCLCSTGAAQQTYYTLFSYDSFVPVVRMNDHAVSLQSSVYPDMYNSRSAERDMNWVAANDSALVAYWTQRGDTILHIMTELSGIEWQEAEFDIYLVRHYPTAGSADPLIIPLGGIGPKGLLKATPQDNRLILNLTFQLARRLLAQTERGDDPSYYTLSRHPLMRQTPYRRDNMAMLLALVTCQNVLGYDSANGAFESAFWKRHFPAREVFKRYLMKEWILSPSLTLADRIPNEPLNSALVAATRPPRKPRPQSQQQTVTGIEGISPTGKLGFTVRLDKGNVLVVDTIDVYRLAYANGLEVGDQIRRVEGKLVRSFRDLVAKLLDGLDQGGAEVEIRRDGKRRFLVFQPLTLPTYEEQLYFEEYFEGDTAYIDEPDYPYDEDEE